MEVRRLSLAEGARDARGLAVVIDVFRAFTCEPLMYAMGAAEVVLEGDIERCRRFRNDAVLVGEADEMPIEGFDLTNSPTLIVRRGRDLFSGRRVVHRTTSGVTGALTAFANCEDVLLSAYVTAAATVRYIRDRSPDVVSICAMGVRSRQPAPEDERCGDYIESLLTGRPYDHVAALTEILGNETAKRFLRGDKDYLPREDVVYCLQRDLFNFALKAERRSGVVAAVPVLRSAG